jgi:hypothetical protein
MQENGFFTPSEATISNLDELSLSMSRLDEARAIEISDLAASAVRFSVSMLAEDLGVYEILSMLAESVSFGEYPTDEDSLVMTRASLASAVRSLSLLDRIEFVRKYTELLGAAGHPLTEEQFVGRMGDGERIGYVRNQYADEAYDVFSQEFRDSRVKYYRGIKECAAALESGEVDYLLLPLEERGGVRLPTVAEIIYRADYKISAVTPVFGFDLGADMKYALVGKGFKHSRHRSGDDRYIELRIPQSADISVADLLSAATSLGMTVYRVNTLTFDTEGVSKTHFFAVLREGGDGFIALLTYLTLFADDYVAVGLYKNLE